MGINPRVYQAKIRGGKMIEKCCHCNEEIKGIRKVKLWNGKLLPMCYLCWSKWINGGRNEQV